MTDSRMTPDEARRLSVAEQHEWFRRATSRRSLLRGGVVGAGALAAGPALLGGSASAAPRGRATPALLTNADRPNGALVPAFGRHIMFGADPTSQMSIAWQVPAAVGNPFVRIGETPFDLGERIPAEIRALTTQRSITTPVDSVPPSAAATIEQLYVHAEISGLRPGRTYFYSVGHQGADGAGGVPSGSFSTAPRGRQPFTFTAFGDQGVTYDAVGTTTLIKAQNPAFHLHAGDISYAEDGGDGLITDPYDPRVWDAFLNEVEPVAGGIPWQVAVGNHEMETWYSPDGYGGQQARFDFPGGGPVAQRPTYYSFTYGNVGIIALDANDVSDEIPANNGYSGGAQTTWLAAQLASLRKDPQIDFIVVYFHHCAYCTCAVHGSDEGPRQFWAPLFDQYSVDLVINGHNHIFERTDPIKAGAATGAAPSGSTVHPATQGTTYITAGGGGESLYDFKAPDSYEGHVDNVASVSSFVNEPGGTTTNETVTWSRVRYTGYCLLVLASQPGSHHGATSRLTIRGLAEDGTELDHITLAR
jgi:Purple acid Phosphatase, N-terminal domain/Calcineurin-like phosphoesterase